MSELINVHLYGDGGRKSRLRAEYIYCDQAKECSAYKDGKCFCVTTFMGTPCGIGEVRIIDGGTKQSKSYREVSKSARENECYAKLKYPDYAYVTRIGDLAFLKLPYIQIYESKSGVLSWSNPGWGINTKLVDKSILTPDNIMTICSGTPRAIMGGTIGEYQDEIVPIFLLQLKSLFPSEYEAFSKAYPNYKPCEVNWIGRYAKLSTCNRKERYKDCHGNVFYFDGDYIVCDHYHSAFTPFSAKDTEIRVKVTDDMDVRITDNNQVLPDTVFR